MRIQERLDTILNAIHQTRASLEEIDSKPEYDKDTADWIGGVEVIQQKKINAQFKAYEKFFNEVVNAMET